MGKTVILSRRRSWRVAVLAAALVGLVPCACSSSGSSTGGAGASSGLDRTDTLCVKDCTARQQLHCPGDGPEASCTSQCTDEAQASGTKCASLRLDYYQCTTTQTAFCDQYGNSSTGDACSAQNTAFVDCVIP